MPTYHIFGLIVHIWPLKALYLSLSWLGDFKVINLRKPKFDLCHGLRPKYHNWSPMDVKKISTYITLMTMSIDVQSSTLQSKIPNMDITITSHIQWKGDKTCNMSEYKGESKIQTNPFSSLQIMKELEKSDINFMID